MKTLTNNLRKMYSPNSGGKYWPRAPCPTFQPNFMPPPPPRHVLASRMLTRFPVKFSPGEFNRFNPMSSIADEPRVRAFKCGDLRESDSGLLVEVSGRVQSNRHHRFMAIRDETGVIQLVIPYDRTDLQNRLANIPIDSYLVVVGEVSGRPNVARNDKLSTGSIEIHIHEVVRVQIKRKQQDEEGSCQQKKKNKPGSNKLTSEEVAKAKNKAMRSYFMARSHTCGDLGQHLLSEEVSMCGWIAVKRPPRFIVFKDGSGEVQMIASGSKPDIANQLQGLNVGTVIFVKGILAKRPLGQYNPLSSNGSFEVTITDLTVVRQDSEELISELKESDSTTNEIDGTIISDTVPVSSSKEIDPTINKYTKRTHTCGELRSSHVGESVVLMGWVEFIRLTKFLILRDGYGSTQILISDDNDKLNKSLLNLPLESVIAVKGTVCMRPPMQIKEEQPTGEIEVLASSLERLNTTGQLPFGIRNFKKAHEPVRMQHRYLDLRFGEMQRNLRMRSAILMKMREFLIHQGGFVEVETPTLFKRTPGGAREFVVPTHNPGEYYSLVQSPQQLKQMLMVGAIDRYFQVARCYRDESTRPDRQPEFTQLDIELSFCSQNDVLSLVEDLISFSLPGSVKTPFPRMTYTEAMETYGSDKPDLRFDWKLVNVTEEFQDVSTTLKSKIDLRNTVQQKNGEFAVYAFVAVNGADILSSSIKEKYKKDADLYYPLTNPYFFNVKDKATTDSKIKSMFETNISTALTHKLAYDTGDALIVIVGEKRQVLECLGKVRLEFANIMEEKGMLTRSSSALNFLWIVDFPLFSLNKNGKMEASHHPFTAPIETDEVFLFDKPLQVTGQHYDLVLNGCEIGGGSIRIHNADLQERVLKEILNISADSLSHLLAALRSGAPPHGGIALGIDRLMAILAGASSIRDVIAFPKSVDGKDPLSGAPDSIPAEDLEYYHLKKTTFES